MILKNMHKIKDMIYLIQKCTPMCKNELFSSSISFQNIKKTTIEPDRKQSSDIREGTYLSWVQLANGIMTLPSLIDYLPTTKQSKVNNAHWRNLIT
jgi:hypothetical protein